jgi:hypothetical protein
MDHAIASGMDAAARVLGRCAEEVDGLGSAGIPARRSA